MLLALSGGQEFGIAAVAAAFIAFALASSFLFPRRDPDFPGRGLRLFLAVTVVLFVSMLTAIAVLARESEEEGHGAAATHTETGAGETSATGTSPTTTGGATQPAGDPAAGKEVFASAGCEACHTLSAAGSTGTVGPNLDEAKPPFDLVVDRVTNGKGVMPSFKGQLSEQQIQDVAAFVVESTQG